jgi:6-phosphogluconate dehydrogenase
VASALGPAIGRRQGDRRVAQGRPDIGLVCLAVMGGALVLNLDYQADSVAAFGRTVSQVDDFLAGAAKGTRVVETRAHQD